MLHSGALKQGARTPFGILTCACLDTSGLAALGQTSTRQRSKTSGHIHEAQRRRGSPLNHLAKPRLSPLCAFHGNCRSGLSPPCRLFPICTQCRHGGNKWFFYNPQITLAALLFLGCPYSSTQRGKVFFLFEIEFLKINRSELLFSSWTVRIIAPKEDRFPSSLGKIFFALFHAVFLGDLGCHPAGNTLFCLVGQAGHHFGGSFFQTLYLFFQCIVFLDFTTDVSAQ